MNIFTKSLSSIVFLLFFVLSSSILKAQGIISLQIEGFYKAQLNGTPSLFKVFYSFNTGALAGTEVFCTDVVSANQGYVSFPSSVLNIPYTGNPPNALKLIVQEWAASPSHIFQYQDICLGTPGSGAPCDAVWCNVVPKVEYIVDFTTIAPGYIGNIDFQSGGTGMKANISYTLPANTISDTKLKYKPFNLPSFSDYKPNDQDVAGGHCYGKVGQSQTFRLEPTTISLPNSSGISYVWEYAYRLNSQGFTSAWFPLDTSTSDLFINNIFEIPNLLPMLYSEYVNRNVLLNPEIIFRVTMQYGPSSSLTTGTYFLPPFGIDPNTFIPLNYPPSVAKPQVPAFAQNNTAITAFNQAVSDSPSMTVEHIKCINTSTGKITIKNPQGLAGKYYVYIRNQSGSFVTNQPMDFRGANTNNTYSFDNLAAGRYEVIIENFGVLTQPGGQPSTIQAGCYSESVFIYVNTPTSKVSVTSIDAPLKAAGGVHVSCKGASDGVINLVVDGGVADYYFKLYKKNGVSWVHEPKATDNVLQNKVFSYTGLSAGEYYVEVQDVFKESACIGSSDPVTLLEPLELTVDVQGTQLYTDEISTQNYQIKNFGGSETIFVSPQGGSANYQVQINGGTAVSVASGNSASQSLSAGSHSYAVQDANGCSKNATFTLTQPLDISLASQSITHVSCNGGSDGVISGTPQGGIRSLNYYDYTLSKPSQAGFNMIGTGANFSFSGLSAGTYVLEVKDRYATIKTYSFVVSEPTMITMLTNSSHKPFVSCFGGSDGVIAFSVSGGSPPYNYEYSNNGGASWSSVASTSGNITISGLPQGNYDIRLKDSKGCFNQHPSGYIRQNILVEEPNSALSLVLIPEHLLCKGDNSGKIYLSGLGGWGSYTFFDAVTNAPVANTISNLPAGTYQYKIRDLQGCEQIASIVLTEPTELIGSSITATPTLCFGEASGSVSILVSGGTSPYQISVDGGALQAYSSGSTITGLPAGNHSLQLVDANNCNKTYNFTITNAPEILISTLSQTPANCGATDGAVSVSVSGGTGAGTYTYTWRNSSNTVVGTNSNTLSNVSSGTYTVTIKDANNCEKQYVAVVPSADGPIGVVNVVQTVSCFGGNDGVASISITQGTSPYSVLWSNGQTSTNVTSTATMSGLVGGSQIAQITDAAGCVQPITFSINQPTSAVGVNTTSVIQPSCHGGNNGSVSVVGTGGTAPYSYLWLDDNSTLPTRNGLKAGSYSVQITDSKGCKITQAITLTEPSPVSANFSESSFTICPNQTLSLDAGNAGSTYEWKKAGTTISSTQQTLITEAGDYELMITTPAGCVGTKTFSVNISNDALKAEFLAATEIEVGDTLVTIDVTNPAPSEVIWSYDVSNPAINRIDNQSIPYYAYFTFSEAGTYIITMQVKLFGCASTLQKTIQVKPKSGRVAQAGLGYQGVGEISKLLVYPNPSGGVFQTKVELVKESPVEILLYGLQNRESYFRQSLSGAKEYDVEVNLPYLPAGNYVLVVKTPQMTKTQQIVISR